MDNNTAKTVGYGLLKKAESLLLKKMVGDIVMDTASSIKASLVEMLIATLEADEPISIDDRITLILNFKTMWNLLSDIETVKKGGSHA